MKKLSYIFTLVLITSQLSAIDTTPFYRASFFQGEPLRNVADTSTNINVRYMQGSTRESFDTEEHKVPLFSGHGPFDLRKLSANIENLNATDKPLTYAYSIGSIPKLPHGKLHFGGKFKTEEIDITIDQNLLYGLYLQAYIPFREVKLNQYDLSKSVTTQSEHNTLVNFVNNDLDGILAENGLQPWNTPYKHTKLSDPVISLGWRGMKDFKDNFVDQIRGSLQGGIIIPAGGKQKLDYVFSIPTGHNGYFGLCGNVNAQLRLYEKFIVGLNGGARIFFEQSDDLRMTTSTSQQGWIVLETGHTKINPGTIWNIGAHAKAENIVGGLSTLIGVNFTQQEKTILTLKDNDFLQTAFANGIVKNKNEVINSNKLLELWYQYVLHLQVGYDLGVHLGSNFAPQLTAEYSIPFVGKHVFATDMFGGNLNLSLGWEF